MLISHPVNIFFFKSPPPLLLNAPISNFKIDHFGVLGFWWATQKTQRPHNVFDVGPALYKCYTNVLCLLGSPHTSGWWLNYRTFCTRDVIQIFASSHIIVDLIIFELSISIVGVAHNNKSREILNFANFSSSRNLRNLKPREYYRIYIMWLLSRTAHTVYSYCPA